MKKEFSVSVFLLGAISTILLACNQVKFNLPPVSDSFAQNITYNNKVDILWIVDNSSSMLKHQQNLSSQIPALVLQLNSLKMDYHMAVVTTSMGGTLADGGQFLGSPKYVTSTTPNLVANLRSRLIVGENGSNNERGLDSLEKALSVSYLSNEGAGFFRPEALFVVIALSDENDKSISAISADHVTQFLDQLKQPWNDGSRSWVFNFIGVLPTSVSCRTFNDYSEAGLTFMDLASVSGGVQESICTGSLSTAVKNIRSRIYQILTDFKLSNKPFIESIVVTINGIPIARSQDNGWDYIEAENLIRFYGDAIPAADAVIKVDFKPMEAN